MGFGSFLTPAHVVWLSTDVFQQMTVLKPYKQHVTRSSFAVNAMSIVSYVRRPVNWVTYTYT